MKCLFIYVKLNLHSWLFFLQSPGIEKDDEIEDSVESSPNRDMTTYSQHYFGSIKDGFSISIIENMKEEYGLFVWPSSVILAEYVWQQKSRFSGVNVVELGAGTSLPGLIASKVGADVTLTDDLSKAEVLSNMRRVCNINDIKCKVMGVTWGVFESPIFTLHPKIILGADVLYDTSGFDDLFLTVTFCSRNAQIRFSSPPITTEVLDGEMASEVYKAARRLLLPALTRRRS
ncbi:hypothetical protein SASPL_120424 [Salvia splendens]|uniref:Methyltransferase-like protein 23 n=1 Tax=Salvia splendens TaxID=180675 RepID=A0A8X8XQT4_SALSN|nr:hypothetical protein SASPL_120424 [Salvia splendens]